MELARRTKVLRAAGVAFSTTLAVSGVAAAPAEWKPERAVEIVAVTAPKRLHGLLADVPTWREQGYDAEVSTWRFLIGPKDMTAGQIAYWENAFRRLVETDEWKKELEDNFWATRFMGSAETRKFMARDNEQVRTFLADLGLAR